MGNNDYSEKKSPISIIDYGVINTNSIFNLMKSIKVEIEIVTEPSHLDPDTKTFILPGVGNFDYGMKSLIESGFSDHLFSAYQNGSRIIGICLGFQMLGLGSPEGTRKGLGLIDSECLGISGLTEKGKAINNGWGGLTGEGEFGSIAGKFYFTHGFGFSATELKLKYPGSSTYRLENTDIAAGIVGERFAGLQFHPERSHQHGENLMRRILKFWNI